jgi:putative intracellular protease/amidase
VVYDAVFVPAGVGAALAAQLLAQRFVHEAYRHGKPIAVAPDDELLLDAAGVPPARPQAGPKQARRGPSLVRPLNTSAARSMGGGTGVPWPLPRRVNRCYVAKVDEVPFWRLYAQPDDAPLDLLASTTASSGAQRGDP